jgi:hypothetical protein
MGRRSFGRDCSGQVLVVSALLVSLLLLSTALYVIEVGKDVPTVDFGTSPDLGSYKTSTKNTLVSALANVSNGGAPSVLASDLDALKAVICGHSYKSMLSLDYSLLNSGAYSQGIWLSWGSSGIGVSSVFVTFNLNSSGYSGASSAVYSVNVTSALHVKGNCSPINESEWQVNLTMAVSDEIGGAAAKTFVFRIHNGTDWVLADSPVLIDYGDGSYSAIFNVDSSLISEPLVASVACLDTRGISVGANVTCNHMI